MFSDLGIPGAVALLVLIASNVVTMSAAQCLTGNDSPSMMKPESRHILTDARFAFALDSLRKVIHIESEDNVFFSPHSLHQALSLAYFGARGTTESALKNALHIPEDFSKVDVQRYYSLENSLKQYREENATVSYEYKTANRFWVTSTKKMRECMLNLFGSELEQMDFKTNPEAVRVRINDWVSNTTKGHIRDLIPIGGVTEDSDLILANAVYFKGLWQSRFEPANSKKDIFYASGSRNSHVTFMRQKGSFDHVVSEVLGAHVLQLPYKGDEISMFILLPPFATARSAAAASDAPQSRDTIYQLVERITATAQGAAEFRDLLDNGMPPREVEVSLPKFTVKRELALGQLLNAMGAGELLVPGAADLRGFVAEGEEGLHLGNAVHRARIEVTEEGTTAAAATALFSFRSSRPAEPAVFNANHPFLYFIYDKPTRTILFTGVFRNPPPPPVSETPLPLPYAFAAA